MNIQTKAIPSPCTGICTMDGALGLCLGCGRTGDEITEWSSAGDVRRSAIWAVLPERIDALGISITRLPWSHDRIAEFVAESLGQRSGTQHRNRQRSSDHSHCDVHQTALHLVMHCHTATMLAVARGQDRALSHRGISSPPARSHDRGRTLTACQEWLTVLV